jgi:hypothetical protein
MSRLGFMCMVDKRSASTLILRLRQWWMRYRLSTLQAEAIKQLDASAGLKAV